MQFAASKHRESLSFVLDTVATLAMIAMSLVVIWAVLRAPKTQQTAPRQQGSRVEIPLPTQPIDFDEGPVIGVVTAKLGVIEYSDFECPFCAKFAGETLPTVLNSYVASGKIRFAFRHLPLEGIHRSAFRSAEAAECAAQQGNFWQMHAALFELPPALDAGSLFVKARRIGLEPRRFEECMKGQAAERVRKNIADAQSHRTSRGL